MGIMCYLILIHFYQLVVFSNPTGQPSTTEPLWTGYTYKPTVPAELAKPGDILYYNSHGDPMAKPFVENAPWGAAHWSKEFENVPLPAVEFNSVNFLTRKGWQNGKTGEILASIDDLHQGDDKGLSLNPLFPKPEIEPDAEPEPWDSCPGEIWAYYINYINMNLSPSDMKRDSKAMFSRCRNVCQFNKYGHSYAHLGRIFNELTQRYL